MTDDHEIEVTQDVTSFVAELRRLADALESGSAYTIDLDGDLVTIPMNATLSVAHEEDDGDVELEFQLSWSPDLDQRPTEILRQQWNFSPNGATRQTEDIRVDLPSVAVLELTVTPDIGGGEAPGTLTRMRLA